LTTFCAAL